MQNITPIYEEEFKIKLVETAKEINKMFEKPVTSILASVPDVDFPIFLKRKEDLLTKHENNPKEKFVSDLIFGASDRAEEQCVGSGKLAMYLCSLLIENNSVVDYDTYEKIKSVIRSNVVRPKKKEFIKAIKNISSYAIKSDKYIDLLIDSCLLGGIESKITTSIDQYSDTTVSYHHGFGFNVTAAHPLFKKVFGNGINNPKTVVYDGRINSPSEIFVLLHYASKTKEPVVIFARGFSESVLYDLKTNVMKGTIKVLPIVIPRTIDTVNTLNDITLVTGSRLIMPQAGDVISTFDHTVLSSQTKKISLHDNSITILSGIPRNILYKKISDLKQSIDSSEIDFERDVLYSRIKSLTLKSINISIPSFGKTHVQLQNDFYEIDTCLKLIQGTIRFGVLDCQKLFKELDDILKDDSELLKIFKRYKDFLLEKKELDLIPSIHIMASVRSAFSTYNLIKDCSIAVIHDK